MNPRERLSHTVRTARDALEETRLKLVGLTVCRIFGHKPEPLRILTVDTRICGRCYCILEPEVYR